MEISRYLAYKQHLFANRKFFFFFSLATRTAFAASTLFSFVSIGVDSNQSTICGRMGMRMEMRQVFERPDEPELLLAQLASSPFHVPPSLSIALALCRIDVAI
jgi:hypothetical protein